MNWFSVKITYASKISDSFEDGLSETRIILLRANDPDAAAHKSKILAEEGRARYKNPDNEEVEWVVTEIDEARDLEVDELVDGIEVFSEMQILR